MIYLDNNIMFSHFYSSYKTTALCTHTLTHTHTHTNTHTNTHTYTYTHKHTYTHTHTNTNRPGIWNTIHDKIITVIIYK